MIHVDETNFLVAIVADYATAAQAVCLRVLEEVLLHFIGHLDRSDIRLRRVEAIADGELATSDIDTGKVPRLEDVERRAADIAPTAQREREKNPMLFRAVSGRSLRVDFSPTPVTSLKHGVMTALHLSQQVTDVDTDARLTFEERDALTDADLIRIDEATLDYASLFTTGEQEAGYVALIIPISYRTLLNRRGRAALIEAGAGNHAFRTGGLFEIIDMDTGTPPSRLAEAVSLARTLCRGVFARLPERPGNLTPFAGIGFAGLTVPLARQGARGVESIRVVRSQAEQLKKAFRALIALEAGREDIDRLSDLGFTHASVTVERARSVQMMAG